jgi:membrane protein
MATKLVSSLPALGNALGRKTVFLWNVLKKVYYDIARHDLSGQASVLAYSHLFSLFPFLLCLSGLIGIFGQSTDLIPWVMARIELHFPRETLLFIEETFKGISRGYAPGVLTVGFVALLYLVSRTYIRLMRGVSIAFGSTIRRNIIWSNLLGLIMALLSLAAVLVAFNLVVVGTRWMNQLLAAAQITGFWKLFGTYLRYPFAFVLIFLVVLLIYRVCPTKKLRAGNLWPGALFFTVMWMVMTRAFGIYLTFFNRYNLIYGTLGGLMILMVWFYMTAFLLLLGAEIAAAVHEVRTDHVSPSA